MREPVWVVASGAAAERWTHGLATSRGGGVVTLPWSEIVAAADAPAVRDALQRIGPDLVLLTSPNVGRVLPEGIGAGYGAVCVGNLTAAVAQELGFAVRRVGTGTGADLARALLAEGEPGLLLFLRGDVVRREGLDLLEAAGWRIEELVVYEARPRPGFEAEVAEAPAPEALIVGSPQAAAALARALEAAGRGALRSRPTVCLGATTAQRLHELGFAAVHVCDEAGLAGIQRALGLALPRDASP